jgi:hypothetical protein
MKPTPKTDQWETYCDECYYHMWRLRRKTERGWHDGFHIHTGEEAKGLCDLLNNLERELAEARGQANDMREKWLAKGLCCEHLGAELHEAINQRDEARGQRDRLAAKALHKVLTDRDFPEWLDENNIKAFREVLQSLTPNEP